MEIKIAEDAGFCFGVKRATDCVEKLMGENGSAKIYTLGKLIHNSVYISELKKKGVHAVEEKDIDFLASESDRIPTVLVIRAHGITKECNDRLDMLCESHRNFKVCDMTCPFVLRIHKIAEENTREDTLFLLLGNKDHPESIGTLSYAKGKKAVFATCEEMQDFLSEENGNKEVIFASQTTQSVKEAKKCQEILKKLYTNTKIFDTICSVTENRQTKASELSRVCDGTVVIGGRDSSNTHRLYDICKQNCPNTQWIESVDELCLDRFEFCDRIGITAGASTPAKLIQEVHDKMNNEAMDFATMLEESFKTIHTGETVRGTVIAIDENAIYVHLGTKVTGVIARNRITDDDSVKLNTLVKVGDEIEAFVIRVNDKDGVAELDKKRVDGDLAWKEIVALKESGEQVDATITDAIKGGVLVNVNGFKVFMPASQVSVDHIEDLSSLVGTTKKVVIIDIDFAKKRAVCSAKVIEREAKKAAQDKIWATLKLGQQFEGTVKNFIPHGAFVDLGGIDGLIPNEELSWKRIKHPSQVLTIGQTVAVTIKDLKEDTHKITLAYKTEEMDPFYNFKKSYKVGDDVEAKIVSLMPFGAFAEVIPGCDGLIHISKISRDKVEKPEDVIKVGDVVKARITDIDVDNRKFNLSMRVYADEEFNKQKNEERAAERAARDAKRKAEAEEKAQLEAEMAPYIVKSVES